MGPRFTRGLCHQAAEQYSARFESFQWGRALRADCVPVQGVKVDVNGFKFQWGRALRADCVMSAAAANSASMNRFQWGRALRADCVRCYASP